MNNPRFEPVAHVWRSLAGISNAFTTPETTIVRINPDSRICPSGWAGFVRLGDSAIITAPDGGAAALIETAMPVTGESLLAILEPNEVLGPAVLLYLDRAAFWPTHAGDVEMVNASDPYLQELEDQAGPADAGEAGVSDSLSPVFATWSAGGQITAASGYRPWLDRLAHISVLTHPAYRSLGLGKQVASAASAYAFDHGLIPQWRALTTNARSLQTAAALGFEECGLQISFRL